MQANEIYTTLLKQIIMDGDVVNTRNSEVYSHYDLPNVTFTSVPLVTLRKTAWKKALREMEWFLSGDAKCPDELLDWWDGQLDKDGNYWNGYGNQLRHSTTTEPDEEDISTFDQVRFIKKALKNNPNSRRLLMTTWNAGEMARITDTNENPNTPTCCHSIAVQFFVRNGCLSMKTYQRSADMLLGVPHNWVQSWAMLMWFAHHAGLKVGSMTWMWGDAHIYRETSHLSTVSDLIAFELTQDPPLSMVYTPTSEGFKASDFTIQGTIPCPVITTRPKLL
jgi:thymidylate synthase